MGTWQRRPPRAARPRPEPLFAAVAADQFAAQAVAAVRRELLGKAFVVVRQNQESHRASVFARSPAARELGVAPGEPVFVLRRRLGRRALVVERDEEAEQRVRERLLAALAAWTPDYRLDELARGTLALSGTPAQRALDRGDLDRAGLGERLARHLRRRTGLQEIAAAVSRSRLLAGLLAERARPDGVEVCAPDQEAELLANLELDELPLPAGVRETARRYGLHHAAQVLALERPALHRRFGGAAGEQLYGLVRGIDGAPGQRGSRAVVAETTLERDVNDEFTLVQAVRLTADKLVDQLRRAGYVASRLTLQLRYTDNRTAQRSLAMPAARDDFATVAAAAVALFTGLHQRRAAIRSIRVSAIRPGRDSGQLDLFEEEAERRQRRLGRAITEIRQRMGFGAVVSAAAAPVLGAVRPSGGAATSLTSASTSSVRSAPTEQSPPSPATATSDSRATVCRPSKAPSESPQVSPPAPKAASSS